MRTSLRWRASFSRIRRWRVLHELREAGVRLEKEARVVSIETSRVRFTGPQGGVPDAVEEVACDHVLLATGLVVETKLVDQLAAAGIEAHAIGDCTGVGYIEGAIRDGSTLRSHWDRAQTSRNIFPRRFTGSTSAGSRGSIA